MKEKIKNALIPIGIIYMVVIIILSLISYHNAKGKISLSLGNNYKESMNTYKEEANKINNKECKNYVNNLINYVDKTNYEGEVLVKDLFNRVFISNDFLLSYYLKGIESCSLLTKEKAEEYNLPNLFMTASLMDDAILSKYTTQYEILIKDNLIREIVLPDLTSSENSIKQKTELMIIKNIIQIIKEGETLNEE